MKIQDLRYGMRCTNRDGETFLVDKVVGDTIHCQYKHDGIFQCGGMQEDLTNKDLYDLDIMKVEVPVFTWYETIWTRDLKEDTSLCN